MTYYLNEAQITEINRLIIERYSPKEPKELLNPSALNMIVNLPEQYVFGQQLYPTLFDKATILFVQLVKKHVFANGNKRTAFFVLVKFLRMNGYKLDVEVDDAVEFTVGVAVNPLNDELLQEYKMWIEQRTSVL